MVQCVQTQLKAFESTFKSITEICCNAFLLPCQTF